MQQALTATRISKAVEKYTAAQLTFCLIFKCVAIKNTSMTFQYSQ